VHQRNLVVAHFRFFSSQERRAFGGDENVLRGALGLQKNVIAQQAFAKVQVKKKGGRIFFFTC
jgi:hypothetical protein